MTSSSTDATAGSGTPRDSDTPSLLNQAPKYGMLIPSRVFVGGIASKTTEAELKEFFTLYGLVRDCKIILDRAGVSKGYGFVTFESLEDAENLIKKEGDHVTFKDRKLNIGPAIRKQALPRIYDPTAAAAIGTGSVLYANGVPYTFQNGLAMFQAAGDGYAQAPAAEFSPAAQLTTGGGVSPTAAYQMMLNPQAAAYMTTQEGAPSGVQWLAASPGWQWPSSTGQAVGLPISAGAGLQVPVIPECHSLSLAGRSAASGTGLGSGLYFYPVPTSMLTQQTGSMLEYMTGYPPGATTHPYHFPYQCSPYNGLITRTDSSCSGDGGGGSGPLMIEQSGAIMRQAGAGGATAVGPHLQYIEMPYATMSSATVAITASMSTGVTPRSLITSRSSEPHHPASTSHHNLTQYHGVKRMLVPHYCDSPGGWGMGAVQHAVAAGVGGARVYGIPPMKIIKTDGVEVQIIPKPSSQA